MYIFLNWCIFVDFILCLKHYAIAIYMDVPLWHEVLLEHSCHSSSNKKAYVHPSEKYVQTWTESGREQTKIRIRMEVQSRFESSTPPGHSGSDTISINHYSQKLVLLKRGTYWISCLTETTVLFIICLYTYKYHTYTTCYCRRRWGWIMELFKPLKKISSFSKKFGGLWGSKFTVTFQNL